MKGCQNLKMKNKEIIESKISMFFDAITTGIGLIGVILSHFWYDNRDWFLICSLVSCFSFNNLAESHERYYDLINERNRK